MENRQQAPSDPTGPTLMAKAEHKAGCRGPSPEARTAVPWDVVPGLRAVPYRLGLWTWSCGSL